FCCCDAEQPASRHGSGGGGAISGCQQIEILISCKGRLYRLHEPLSLEIAANKETTGQCYTLTRQGCIEAECCLVEPQASCLEIACSGNPLQEGRPEIVGVMQEGQLR